MSRCEESSSTRSSSGFESPRRRRQLTGVEHDTGGTHESVDKGQGRSRVVGAGDVVGHLSPQADRRDAGGVMGHLERSLHACGTSRVAGVNRVTQVGRGGGDRQPRGTSVR